MATEHKPYVWPMTFAWWKKLPFYRFYMMREGTVVPAIWSNIMLIYGLFTLKHGVGNWAGYIGLLQNPVMVILSLVTLAVALLYTKTWFELAPKAASVIIEGGKMGPEPVIKGLWVVTVVVIMAILFVALLW